LGPKQVQQLTSDYPVPEASEFRLLAIRREINRLDAGQASPGDFVAWVLEHTFGFTGDALTGTWLRGSNVKADLSHSLLNGETVKPRHVWTGVRKGMLPVFIDKSPRLGIGRGRKAVSDVLQWLRLAGEPLALVTNTRQWRLVFAGLDFDASCESDLELWLEEGTAGLQFQALQQLLQPALWDLPSGGGEPPLVAAIRESRKGQAELSSILGERVREAVEALVRAHGQELLAAGLETAGADIYRAAVRVVMRLVVILFAESRDLLPRTSPLYYESYSLQGLFDQLQRQAVRGRSRLKNRHTAWPRILALFRLVFDGSHHESILIRQYGGELFRPAPSSSSSALLRSLRVFEKACFESGEGTMPDSTVHLILELLTRTRVRVRQGRTSISTLMPVDFGGLSSEYIGILYEGLLDYELRMAPADEPVVFLGVGNEPSLPLARLEAMSDSQIRDMLKELGKSKSDDENDSETEEVDAELETDQEEAETANEEDESDAEGEEDKTVEDLGEQARGRALAWTERACVAAGLARKPRGKLTPEKQMQFERNVGAAARKMLRRLVLPGEWYLVRWGGTRKGSGTFYTRPQLAIPLVQRTLRPLAYTPPSGEDGEPNIDAPAQEWTPKKPEEILALKVADIAGGSGSFPVAALRFLTTALYQSLWTHGRIRDDRWRQPLPTILGLVEGPVEDDLESERLPAPPDADDFEPRTKALLSRYAVERCIYAVDLDPLSVELCRLALWIETMDRELPFSFLDHKIKCGNALVGCWFDHFRHYPVLAWKREGGDKTHTNGVHCGKEERTKALKSFVNDQVKADLELAITGQGDLFAGGRLKKVTAVHDAALSELRAIHDLPVRDDTGERANRFKELEEQPEWVELQAAFDRWCACWFWPADQLDDAPLPTTLASPSAATAELVSQLSENLRFFHWELAFPDVFDEPGAGFDAILGNPPWEVAKPNSKEFFSNYDPLYRTYGKQEGLRRQTELFSDVAVESAWLDYCARFKSMSTFAGNAAYPFGDPKAAELGGTKFSIARGKKNAELHGAWRRRRDEDAGYADPCHPFQHQGSADLNLYKMFLEQVHALLRPQGRLGIIVPSGLYSDQGSKALRALFLDQCQWEWLFGFENREKIFDIDGRFKFNPIIVQKGGKTDSVRTAFMRRDIDDWADAEQYATPYERAQVEQFSPNSLAILEIQSARDLAVLEKMYGNAVLLGAPGDDGWGIDYSREFDMTNDSKLFPPLPKWESQGYQADEYSRWLKGSWRPIDELWKKLGVDPLGEGERRTAQPPYDTLPIPRADIPVGTILSRDADAWIVEDDVEDVALPLYEGRMIGQFDFSQKGWVSGKGRSADWRDIPWERKHIEPQYLMGESDMYTALLEKHLKTVKKLHGKDAATDEERRLADPHSRMIWQSSLRERTGFMAVGSATNERAMIAAQTSGYPHGNAVPILRPQSPKQRMPALTAVLDSVVFDFVFRMRLVGLNLNYFVISEAPLPLWRLLEKVPEFQSVLRGMNCCSVSFAHLWDDASSAAAWREQWAVTRAERIRCLVQIEAVVGACYGIDLGDLAHILKDCDHPQQDVYIRSRGFNAKGFWRVDKEKEPELRRTVLTLVASHDLQSCINDTNDDLLAGIRTFLTQNDGEGWMLPKTLRLADYGLGYGDRAKEPQPVASVFGPRFYDWQEEQPVEESWRECELHARNLLGAVGYEALKSGEDLSSLAPEEPSSGPVEEFQLSNGPVQGDLFQ